MFSDAISFWEATVAVAPSSGRRLPACWVERTVRGGMIREGCWVLMEWAVKQGVREIMMARRENMIMVMVVRW
jgi:hypothetical protein